LATTSAAPASKRALVGFALQDDDGMSAVSGLDLSCWHTL
jgi:hypothetical protein